MTNEKLALVIAAQTDKRIIEERTHIKMLILKEEKRKELMRHMSGESRVGRARVARTRVVATRKAINENDRKAVGRSLIYMGCMEDAVR